VTHDEQEPDEPAAKVQTSGRSAEASDAGEPDADEPDADEPHESSGSDADEPGAEQSDEDEPVLAAGSEPARTAGPEATPVQAPPATRRPLWRRVAELALPPLLAAGAVGVHWKLNVPDKLIESPNDQGSKEKKPDKKKKAREKKPRDAQRDEARTSEELAADWERFAAVPFDDEPTRTAWARRNQVVINRAVVEARRQAFEGAPEEAKVVLASTTCRTVRCRFTLRSPYAHELELIGAALQRLEIAGEPAWRSFEVEAVAPAVDPAQPEAETQRLVQITVAFHTDDIDTDTIEIPAEDAEPGEPAAPSEPTELDEPNDS
jgi:hypothetical protein